MSSWTIEQIGQARSLLNVIYCQSGSGHVELVLQTYLQAADGPKAVLEFLEEKLAILQEVRRKVVAQGAGSVTWLTENEKKCVFG